MEEIESLRKKEEREFLVGMSKETMALVQVRDLVC